MSKIDIDKFVCSLIENYNQRHNINPTVIATFWDDALRDQGLEYKNGEIINIDSPDQVGFEELGKLWQEQHDTPYRTDGLKINEEKKYPFNLNKFYEVAKPETKEEKFEGFVRALARIIRQRGGYLSDDNTLLKLDTQELLNTLK